MKNSTSMCMCILDAEAPSHRKWNLYINWNCKRNSEVEFRNNCGGKCTTASLLVESTIFSFIINYRVGRVEFQWTLDIYKIYFIISSFAIFYAYYKVISVYCPILPGIFNSSKQKHLFGFHLSVQHATFSVQNSASVLLYDEGFCLYLWCI